MFAFAGGEEIDLAAAWGEGAGVLAAGAEQDDFGDVAEIEADASSVRAAILADFVPDEVGFVGEAPGFQDFQALRQEGVGDP